MTHEDFTSFFIIAPPTPTDNRNDANGGGPWGRWEADGSPIINFVNDFDTDIYQCVTSQISGTSWKMVITTEGVVPDNMWAGAGAAVGDYVAIYWGSGVMRGVITSLGTTTSTGDTLFVTAWNTWDAGTYSNARIGGSLQTLHNLTGWNAFCTTAFLNANSKPPRLWIQKDNTITAAATFANSGTAAVPLSVAVYDTTPGVAVAYADWLSMSGSSVPMLNVDGLSFVRFANLNLQSSGAGEVVSLYSGSEKAVCFDGCRIGTSNTATSSRLIEAIRGVHRFQGCYLTCPAGVNQSYWMLLATGGFIELFACVLDGSGAYGLRTYASAQVSATASVFRRYYSQIINLSYVGLYRAAFNGCVIDANVSGTPFVFTGLTSCIPRFDNCIFISPQSGYVFTGGVTVEVNNCAYYNCALTDDCTIIGENNIELSGDPFVSRATGDYRINTASAAGRQLLNAAYPATLPGLSASTNYQDVGALQMRHPIGEMIR